MGPRHDDSMRIAAKAPHMDLHFAITAVATAFTIIDPIGMVPLSLTITAGAPPDFRRRTINRAVLVAAGVIVFMGLVGRAVLSYLGITLPAFSIAGGILLLLISIDMLFARPSGTRKTEEEEQEAILNENVAVFPLAIPMLAGPGTIATVLLLVNLSHNEPARLAIVFASFGLALFTAWLAMLGAGTISRYAGKTGIHVITRLLGIILSALAIQFIINGLSQSGLFHSR
jgi:multiple antibiotic resistance protein